MCCNDTNVTDRNASRAASYTTMIPEVKNVHEQIWKHKALQQTSWLNTADLHNKNATKLHTVKYKYNDTSMRKKK